MSNIISTIQAGLVSVISPLILTVTQGIRPSYCSASVFSRAQTAQQFGISDPGCRWLGEFSHSKPAIILRLVKMGEIHSSFK